MGRVYRGLDRLFALPVAIKTIKSEYLTHTTRDEYLRRFPREGPAAGRLSHPNIMCVYDIGEDYIVMESLEGRTLQAVIKERSLTFEEVLGIISPLADAVDHAHRAGVVHGDIKPVNIMIQPDGRPKLMDFGIAHVDTALITVPGHFFGSPAYLAPEQIRGEETTSRADLFSLAVVAYEALTGHRPFEGESVSTILYKLVHEPGASPRHSEPELPEALGEVFSRALAKAPELRFPSARGFVAALRGEGEAPVLSVDAKPAAPPGIETLPFGVARPRARRHAVLIGAAALLLAGGVAVRHRLFPTGEPGDPPPPLRIQPTPPA